MYNQPLREFPYVSVIIPVYNDQLRLDVCLAALSAQTYPKDLYEVIAVDNASKPPIIIRPEFSNFVCLEVGHTPGAYAARNKGISVAKGEILAFTDSDCIPDPDWIEKAVKLSVDGAQRIAGKVELFYKADKLTAAEIYEKAFALDQEKSAKAGGALTANMITWKDNFAKVGLFNDSLLSGGDNEWGWRAHAKGVSVVYAPSVVVRHPARHTLGELITKEKRVVTGFINIEQNIISRYQRWVMIFRNILPPVITYFRLIIKKDLSIYEKIMAGLISTYLYFYKVYQRIRTALN
jgi:glycosyltransferase involved in cell wall biosynthesis